MLLVGVIGGIFGSLEERAKFELNACCWEVAIDVVVRAFKLYKLTESLESRS